MRKAARGHAVLTGIGHFTRIGFFTVLLWSAAPEASPGATGRDRLPLPDPVVDPHSTEICLNSRLSYHGAWSAAGTEQMLADVLHAASRAPAGAPLTLYAATSANVYLYDPASHTLAVHKSGDWRSDHSAAFEVGVSAANMVDAGESMHLAQLESITLWTGITNQLASCPRASATTYANSNWNPASPVDIAISFGIRSVPGLTTTLVAISSDGTLPNPITNGSVYVDTAMEALAYDSTFAAEDLALQDVSQLLWAAYGCADHYASGKGGLVCSSAVANYYLTRRIYAVGPQAVHRFHNRRPPGTDMTTRDHRIELVREGDARPDLRAGLSRLPVAPEYFVLCVGTVSDWSQLEAGFAAMGAVLEASSRDLQGHVTADLSTGEQAAIRTATGIPGNENPVAVVSLGRPSGISHTEGMTRGREALGLSVSNGITTGDPVTLVYNLLSPAEARLTVHDCAGKVVKRLLRGAGTASGSHTASWDCRDDRNAPVPSGVYFCRLEAGDRTGSVRILVVR